MKHVEVCGQSFLLVYFEGKLLTKVISLSVSVPARLGGQIKFIMEGKWKILMVVVLKICIRCRLHFCTAQMQNAQMQSEYGAKCKSQ